MRFMRAGLAWCFSIVVALHAKHAMKARVQALQRLLDFFETLRLRLNYECAPLPLLLESLEETAQLSFLSDCCARLQAGASLSDAWRDALKKQPPPLKKADMDTLFRLAPLLGATDLDGQSRLLEGAVLSLRQSLDEAKAHYARSAPLVTGLGVFVGFSWFVFLV